MLAGVDIWQRCIRLHELRILDGNGLMHIERMGGDYFIAGACSYHGVNSCRAFGVVSILTQNLHDLNILYPAAPSRSACMPCFHEPMRGQGRPSKVTDISVLAWTITVRFQKSLAK